MDIEKIISNFEVLEYKLSKCADVLNPKMLAFANERLNEMVSGIMQS